MIRQYIIEGEPHPQGRPRFSKYSRAYKDSKSRAYEKKGAALLRAQGAKPTDKPVKLDITFIKPFLKSWSKKKVAEATKNTLYAPRRPDLDNYIKSVLDFSNGLLFDDDGQVVELQARKIYGEEAKTIIEIKELESE